MTDDDLEIKVSGSGLLQSIVTSSDDRTDDVVRKVAETAVSVAQLTAFPGVPSTTIARTDASASTEKTTQTKTCDAKPYKFTLMVDPTNDDATQERLKNLLENFGVGEGCLIVKTTNPAVNASWTATHTDL